MTPPRRLSLRGARSRRRLARLGLLPGNGALAARVHATTTTARPARSAGDATPADLALTLDLIAAALAAGAPLVPALDAVAAACSEATARDLDRVRDLLLEGRLDRTADVPGAPPALLRALRRSGQSGSRLAEQLRFVADDLRADAAASAVDRAHRVGIWAVVPLGLCCLPAFVALAVVPLAYGLFRGTLG